MGSCAPAAGDLGEKEMISGVYTITNTVTCGATVKVAKAWTINGVDYTNENKPAGYSATLTLDVTLSTAGAPDESEPAGVCHADCRRAKFYGGCRRQPTRAGHLDLCGPAPAEAAV